MKPGVDQLLMSIATTLATRILPELGPESYATGDARMSAALAVMIAQEADRAADTLVRENRAMHGLFAKAQALPLPTTLLSSLTEEADGTDEDLRISALTPVHDRLTEKLIALHAAVEESPAAETRAIEREIWAFLLKGAEDRMVVMPAM